MTIMIVDDHIDIRRILRQIISVGHTGELQFIECESGEDAIQLYKTELPDLVLMDIELKNMNGLEAAASILNRNKDAKVLIVSSHDSPSVRKKAALLPIKGFVSKDDLSQVRQYLSY
ncbi:MAG: response regulator transcription factor [Balneolaceae bacterium]|nr:response regulator transcription factor [Balneolaceae bacterium]